MRYLLGGGASIYLAKENVVPALLILLMMLAVWCFFVYRMKTYPNEVIEESIDENGNPKKTHKKFR